MNDPQVAARDSVPTKVITDPPPKDKDHWKTASQDTIKTNPPKFGISNFDLLQDSNSGSTTLDPGENGPKDPPKDKDHWRGN